MSVIDKRTKVYEKEWERTIVRLLKNGSKTQKELKSAIGCSDATLYNWLKFFEAKGLIKIKYQGREKIIELVK